MLLGAVAELVAWPWAKQLLSVQVVVSVILPMVVVTSVEGKLGDCIELEADD